MKRFFLLCLTALCALTTWAGSSDKYDFTVDGIYYYKLSDGTVAVIDSAYQKVTSTYVGDLVIPSSVINPNDGNTYTVSSIFEWAFYKCEITTLDIPESVTSFGEAAFYECKQLKELTIPDGMTSVPNSLCFECNALTSVTIPNTVTSIEASAFNDCSSLTEITIPSGVTEIGNSAFNLCSSLTEITLPENVTSIGRMVFVGCTSLDKLYSLNPEPPTCGQMTFSGITSTCTLYVPQGCYEVYSSTDQWEDFTSIVEINETITPPTVTTTAVSDITDSTATLHGTVSVGSEEILGQGFQYWADANAPQTIVATSVSGEEISSTIQRLSSATEYTFRAYATTATETTYGDRITFTTTNYDFAEENSDGKTIYYKILNSSSRTCMVQYLYYASADNIVAYEGELTIPETVTHEGTTYRVIMINEYAFYECRNLTKVTIPESITDIGPNSFQNCTSLEEATFPSTVSTIWDYTFDGCTSLKEAIISNSVTLVRGYAFRGCTSLEEVTFPGSVNISIYRGFFEGCTGLKKVTLGDGLTSTCYYMFQDCTSLEEVVFPTTDIEIAMYTFYGCTNLKEITLPNSVTSLGSYAFWNCTNLKSCVYSNAMTDTGSCAFYECTNFDDVTFSRNITEISNATFYRCNLEKMEVPEGVTTIGSSAFSRNSKLTTITFPKTLASVNYHVCYDCPNLSTVFSLNPTPPECLDVINTGGWFDGRKDDCILYVPTGSKETYSTTAVWKDFGSIVEIDVLSAETAEATNITETSVTLNGSVTKGTFDVIGQGFEYWTDPLVSTFVAIEGNDLTTPLLELEPSTTYYYRAYATDTTGTTYGETLTFTTEDDIPDGIDSIGMSSTNSENIEGIYSTSGQKLNTTVKGVNIIRYSDGSTKKVIMK